MFFLKNGPGHVPLPTAGETIMQMFFLDERDFVSPVPFTFGRERTEVAMSPCDVGTLVLSLPRRAERWWSCLLIETRVAMFRSPLLHDYIPRSVCMERRTNVGVSEDDCEAVLLSPTK